MRDGGRALPVQRPQHPVLRRRAAVRLPARPVRAALARAARTAARGLRAGHGRAGLAQRPAGRAADARPERPRGAARRAAAGRRARGARADPEGRPRARTCAAPSAARRRRSARRPRRPPGEHGEPRARAPSRPGPSRSLCRTRHRPAGRALKALPTVHAALDALGATHRTVTTRSIDHAYEEAARAVADGRDRGRRSAATACCARSRARSSTRAAPLAIVPCGRGNDFARVLGIPKDPAEAARVAVAGRGAARGRGERRGHALHGHRELRLRLGRATGSPTRRKLDQGQRASTSTRPCARSRPGSRPPSRCRSTASATRSPGTPWRWATRRPTAAGCTSSRTPSSTTASST